MGNQPRVRGVLPVPGPENRPAPGPWPRPRSALRRRWSCHRGTRRRDWTAVVVVARGRRRISRRSATLQSASLIPMLVAHDQGPGVGRERPEHGGIGELGDDRELAPGGRVPLPDRAVVAAGEDRPIDRRDRHGPDRRSMAEVLDDLAARGDVPEADHLLHAGRGERPAVGRERQRRDPLLVRGDAMQLPTRRHVPQMDLGEREIPAVGRAGRASREDRAIGREPPGSSSLGAGRRRPLPALGPVSARAPGPWPGHRWRTRAVGDGRGQPSRNRVRSRAIGQTGPRRRTASAPGPWRGPRAAPSPSRARPAGRRR